MNNILMRKVAVTGEYRPLAPRQTVVSVTISCPPSNAATVYFRGDDGSDVPWIPAEWHSFQRVDLSAIFVKGTAGNVVTLVGGSW